jgi:hypothetical protein
MIVIQSGKMLDLLPSDHAHGPLIFSVGFLSFLNEDDRDSAEIPCYSSVCRILIFDFPLLWGPILRMVTHDSRRGENYPFHDDQRHR